MSFNVSNFRSAMSGDGARPNLFDVNIIFPSSVADTAAAVSDIRFMAKSAQLPGSTIGIAPAFYFGRELKFAGNRTFTDWTVQIINDEGFRIRNALERWMSSINSHVGNVRQVNSVNQRDYSGTGKVKQYGKAGNTLKYYDFVGIFPIDIAPIDLDWGSNDTIEEYAVTFAYQYWTAGSESGSTTDVAATP
jgi:hypothetical protein